MKIYRFLTVAVLFLSLAFTSMAVPSVIHTPTNTGDVVSQVASLKSNVTQTVQTNINQVLVDILSGVKGAGGEIYQASKEAIHKSVDFVSEQAPDVIKQFLKWKFVENLIYAVTGFVIILILLYIARKLWNSAKKQRSGSDEEGMYYFAFVVSLLFSGGIFFVSTLGHVTDAVKISVAPKVYIIEYVVDTVKNERPAGQ